MLMFRILDILVHVLSGSRLEQNFFYFANLVQNCYTRFGKYSYKIFLKELIFCHPFLINSFGKSYENGNGKKITRY